MDLGAGPGATSGHPPCGLGQGPFLLPLMQDNLTRAQRLSADCVVTMTVNYEARTLIVEFLSYYRYCSLKLF